jgi:hypothetical protein
MNTAYEIRLCDEPLIEFEFITDELGGQAARIIFCRSERESVFPLDLALTSEGLLLWLRHRVIPKNREFVEQILQTFDLTVDNTKGIIDVCKGCRSATATGSSPKGSKVRLRNTTYTKTRSQKSCLWSPIPAFP